MPCPAKNKWRNLLLPRHFFFHLLGNGLVLLEKQMREPLRGGLSILYNAIWSAYWHTTCYYLSFSFGEAQNLAFKISFRICTTKKAEILSTVVLVEDLGMALVLLNENYTKFVLQFFLE